MQKTSIKHGIHFPAHIKVYLVGGAVRDQLLGRVVADRDFVVVGANVNDMLALGFKPVGRDFPVFLHPITKEEYALARTERKVSVGYHGFTIYSEPDVTLEEDLARRDLTMNAIAQDTNANLIDPFGGARDISQQIFRHVSDAFGEDPVRILRLARFSARLPSFQIAPETMRLMQQMVSHGEVDALVPERVWQELSQALLEKSPSCLFKVLHACGALQRLLPEFANLFEKPLIDQIFTEKYQTQADFALDFLETYRHTQTSPSLAEMYVVMLSAVLFEMTSDDVMTLSQRLRVPSECADLAVLFAREIKHLDWLRQISPEQFLAVFQRVDIWRRPQRFNSFLNILKILTKMKRDSCNDLQNITVIQEVANVVRQVATGEIAKQFSGNPREIQEHITQARLMCISSYLKKKSIIR